MSHTAVRGNPTAAQLYLDDVLNELLLEQGIKPDIDQRKKVTLTQLTFHCLKTKPQETFIINGATGEVVSNEQHMKRAVPLARALIEKGARGKHVMLLMRNHQHMLVVYYGVQFAGIVPFCMDPNTKPYELTHFLNLIEPAFVFYDSEHEDILHEALKHIDIKPTIHIGDDPTSLQAFYGDFSNDIQSYKVPAASPDDTVLLLPTSGSTGIPKAAAMSHVGMITQTSTSWLYHTKFPTPTRLVMLLTSCQWMTFTMTMTSCVAFQVPVLLFPKNITVESFIGMLERFRPTWTFITPSFASSLASSVRPDQMSSLETLTLLGEPTSPELAAILQSKLPAHGQLCDGYGSTETHGFIAFPDKQAPVNSNGPIVNCLDYKIVDENGEKLGPKQTGQLLVKGACLIQKYHKNDNSFMASMTPDGWYKTGDMFYLGEDERVSFVARIKFNFKFQGRQVAPEEIERIIYTVAGVRESVVCATDNGPAAAVVKQPDAEVTEVQIHQVVNGLLSEHKHLHGGIIFVPSLPHTHTGKIDRQAGSALIIKAINDGNVQSC